LQRPPEDGPLPGTQTRMVRRRGDAAMEVIGLHDTWYGDAYHHALTAPWRRFVAIGTGLYLGSNVVFAALYLLERNDITNARPGSFGDAFFFSVQTMATIGYGVMAPKTLYANLLMTAEVLFGIMVLALATGLAFARFSRPRARIMFSHNAVVALQDGVPTVMVRLANERRNQILQAEVAMTLLRTLRTAEGEQFRRFHDLKLSRTRTPVFALTMTAMHAIDAASPLFGATPESLRAEEAELLVTVSGIDESLSQTIHARTSYLADEILFGARFVDMFGLTADRRRALDYRNFHLTEALRDRAAEGRPGPE
jgi:inward rectifier potassium channel